MSRLFGVFAVFGIASSALWAGGSPNEAITSLGGRQVVARSANLLTGVEVRSDGKSVVARVGSRSVRVTANGVEMGGGRTVKLPAACKRVELVEGGDGVVRVLLDGVAVDQQQEEALRKVEEEVIRLRRALRKAEEERSRFIRALHGDELADKDERLAERTGQDTGLQGQWQVIYAERQQTTVRGKSSQPTFGHTTFSEKEPYIFSSGKISMPSQAAHAYDLRLIQGSKVIQVYGDKKDDLRLIAYELDGDVLILRESYQQVPNKEDKDQRVHFRELRVLKRIKTTTE